MKKFVIITMAVVALAFFNTSAFAGPKATAEVNDVSANIITEDNSVNTSEAMERGFPIAGSPNFGPVINYYGKPLPGSQFRPVESLLMYANVFTEGALESIIKKGKDADLIVDLNVVRGRKEQPRAKYAEGEPRWIKIVATTQMLPDHGLIGYVTAEADDRKTDMMEVIAGAALDALKEGADVLQIVAQGAARDTETSGWGIGFNTTVASTLGNGDGTMNVSSGGTGYSSAWAGMRDKPWLQANALKAPYKVVGTQVAKVAKDETPAVAKAEDTQTGNHTSSGSKQE